MNLRPLLVLATVVLLLVARVPAARAQTFELLHRFEAYPAAPAAGLTPGPDGSFYGTTAEGGATNEGTVFRVDAAGTVTTLAEFTGGNGRRPLAGLVPGPGGNFYGTTSGGFGDADPGTVFTVTPAGALTTLVRFTGANGRNPYAALTPGPDGNFYGTTYRGGTADKGTVFRVTPAGVLTVLVHFSGANGDSPYASVVFGPGGDLYGTTQFGGTGGNFGTAFRVTTAGALQTLWHFGDFGANPRAGLTVGADGNLYGLTAGGGTYSSGTAFRLTPAGALQTLVSFQINTTGSNPVASLVRGPGGDFYGTTNYGGSNSRGTVFRLTPAGALTILTALDPPSGDGPEAPLIVGTDGNLYGTAVRGGARGHGSVFRVTPEGAFTLVASLRGLPSGLPGALSVTPDGALLGTTPGDDTAQAGTVFRLVPGDVPTTLASFPVRFERPGAAPVVRDPAGNLYGTTPGGGSQGVGTAFRLTPPDPEATTVTPFNFALGAKPSGLVRGPDGNFYGTAEDGGANQGGSVFRLTPAGTLGQLAGFSDPIIRRPHAPLTVGNDGHLYGTTSAGGNGDQGVIFRVTTGGTLTTVGNLTPSGRTEAPLTFGPSGDLYGTSSQGGSAYLGSIFRLPLPGNPGTPAPAAQTAISFLGPNGARPAAGLTRGPDNALYGTTETGGASDQGTIFKLSLTGALTTLLSFDGATQGAYPRTAPVFGPDNHLYGTAGLTVYRLRLPPPPAEAWRRRYFDTTENTGNAADDADPDGDGVRNLLERALGLNPTAAGTAGLPVTKRDATTGRLTLIATKGTDAADLVFAAEASADLVTWTSADVTVLTDTATLFQARDDGPAGARRFLRLRVTRP